MTPEQPTPLADAATRKRAAALDRAAAALRDLDAAAAPISFQSVARHAGVSRQWLYGQPELRADIERLRDQPHRSARVPSGQRASEHSLRQRVDTLRDENHRLREANRVLRAELALAHGERREAGLRPLPVPAEHDT